MSDHRDRRWISWRGRPAGRLTHPAATQFGRLVGYDLVFQNRTVTDSHPQFDPLAALKAERPGPDGVRVGLVARVRELIAEGAYDTPERWAEAERRLLQRVIDRRCI